MIRNVHGARRIDSAEILSVSDLPHFDLRAPHLVPRPPSLSYLPPREGWKPIPLQARPILDKIFIHSLGLSRTHAPKLLIPINRAKLLWRLLHVLIRRTRLTEPQFQNLLNNAIFPNHAFCGSRIRGEVDDGADMNPSVIRPLVLRIECLAGASAVHLVPLRRVGVGLVGAPCAVVRTAERGG